MLWLAVGAAAALAGFAGATSGGSGVILLPLLVLACEDPVAGIASAKVAVYFGVFPPSVLRFSKADLLDARRSLRLGLAYGAGLVVGIVGLDRVQASEFENRWLYLAIAVSLVIAAIASHGWTRRRLKRTSSFVPSPTRSRWAIALALVLGIYSSSFPASGLFLVGLMVVVLGQDYVSAVANKALVQLLGMLVPTVLYIVLFDIAWGYVAAVLVCGSIGSYLGASYALRADHRALWGIFFSLTAVMVGLLVYRAVT